MTVIGSYVSGYKDPKTILGELIRKVCTTRIMKSLYTIVTVLAAIALIGSIGASFQQHAFAIIGPDITQFKLVTGDYEKAISEALAANPPNPDKIQQLAAEYCDNVKMIFASTSSSASPSNNTKD